MKQNSDRVSFTASHLIQHILRHSDHWAPNSCSWRRWGTRTLTVLWQQHSHSAAGQSCLASGMALSQCILIFCSLTLSQRQTAMIGPDHDSEVDEAIPESCEEQWTNWTNAQSNCLNITCVHMCLYLTRFIWLAAWVGCRKKSSSEYGWLHTYESKHLWFINTPCPLLQTSAIKF